MRADYAGEEDDATETATIVLGVLLGVSVVVAVVLGICACRQLKDQSGALVDEGGASQAAGGDKLEGGEAIEQLDDPSEEVHLSKMKSSYIDNERR